MCVCLVVLIICLSTMFIYWLCGCVYMSVFGNVCMDTNGCVCVSVHKIHVCMYAVLISQTTCVMV